MEKYSVLMSVYQKEQPDFLCQAIDSIFHQTREPDEMVLVCDGPLTPQLDEIISAFQKQYGPRMQVLRLETNVGLGAALSQGVPLCRNRWIARMDSDDICLPDRMEKQMAYIEAHPTVSVVGGQITEFIDDPQAPIDMRCVPLQQEEIRKTLAFKNPMNHVTTVFNRDDVLAVGNYEDRLRFEDYHLWTKLLAAGYELANIPDCCCYVRAGSDAWQRRGGMDYFRQAASLYGFMLKKKLASPVQYVRNLCIWFAASVLIPSKLRGFLFRKVMRKQVDTMKEGAA